VLAVVLLPLVLRALQLALTGRFVVHRRWARVTWPIWMYVSVTGVVVYWMLYHLAPRMAA
jgi:putative membrane protein